MIFFEYSLGSYFIFWGIMIIFKQYFSPYLFYVGFILLLFINIIIYLLKNPTECLIPYNWVLENIYDKIVFYSDSEKKEIFPSSIILENKWEKIRDEFLTLKIEKGNIGKNFIQKSNEFWNGWDTISLRSFNQDNEENMNKCPTLAKILKNDTNITTAFFSVLKPGKCIHSHYGPFKGILRYHIGLIIPPKDSGECFISVDNQIYEWNEGEGILFDETYKHFVNNNTPYSRVILFLDVKRPVHFPFINDLILYLMSISPYNN